MSRKKEMILNLSSSLISQFVILIFGFIVPKIMLTSYGSDVNGLTSSVTQIFSYVALLESGIGLAAKNALYKPIHDKNENEINKILYAAKNYYRKITYFYILIVLIISFLAPLVLKTEVDYWTIFFLIIFEGLTSAITFYFVDYYICYLSVVGKNYVINSVDLISRTLCYVVKILLALAGINIALIQVGFFIISILKVIIYKIYMKKKYPQLNLKKIENQEEYKLPQRRAFIATEIAWTIFSSTDMIILSIFVDTKISSVYAVYNMIFVALNSIINSIYNAVFYNLGNIYYKDLEKYKKVHNIFTSAILSICTILMCVSMWLTLPFIKLYTAGINDVNYIYIYLPTLFGAIQMLSWSRYVSGNLTSVAGYAKQVGIISIIEASMNIILSLILVQFIGLYGVLISTVISLPLKVIYTNYLSEKIILKRSSIKNNLIILTNYFIFAITCILSIKMEINININNYLMFIVYGVVLTLLYTIIVLAINIIINKDLVLSLRIIKNKNT